MRVPPFIFLAFCLGVFLIGAKGGAGATVRNNYNSNWIQTGHDPQHTNRLPPAPNRRPILSQPSVLFDALDSSAALYTSGVQNTQPLIHNDVLYFVTGEKPQVVEARYLNGTTRWIRNVIEMIFNEPQRTITFNLAISSDGTMLYIVTVKSSNKPSDAEYLLAAVTTHDGSVSWVSPQSPCPFASSPLIHPNGNILLSANCSSNSSFSIYALKPNGSPDTQFSAFLDWGRNFPVGGNWESTYFGGIRVTPTGDVYFLYQESSGQYTFVALASLNGTTLWQAETTCCSNLVLNSIRSDGVIVFESYDASTPQQHATRFLDPNAKAFATSTIPNFQPLAVGESQRELYGVQRGGNNKVPAIAAMDDVIPRWLFHADVLCAVGATFRLVVDGGDVIYVYSHNDVSNATFLFALNLTDGGLLWQMQLANRIPATFAPILAEYSNRTILVAQVDNQLGYSYLGAVGCCSGKGACLADGCTCDMNYFTDDCSVYCNTSMCNSVPHRQCNQDTGACVCENDYFPADTCEVHCNTSECDDIPNRQCTAQGCVCVENWYGAVCDKFCCDSPTCTPAGEKNTCNNHGSCNFDGGCDCFYDFWDYNQYSGNHCSPEPNVYYIVVVSLMGLLGSLVFLLVAWLLYRRFVPSQGCWPRRVREYKYTSLTSFQDTDM